MKFTAYLSFKDNCEEAFAHYKKVFGGEIPMTMRFSESPMGNEVPAGWENKIMHTRLVVGDGVLMGSDSPPGCGPEHTGMSGFSISVAAESAEEAEKIFNGLAEGGHVIMPLQETFWATRFGMVADRFGVSWMVNMEKAWDPAGAA